MPLPGPAVGDYLKPIRDSYRRSKLSSYVQFRLANRMDAQPEPPPIARKTRAVATAKSEGA